MANLTASQSAVLRSIFVAAPDTVVFGLEKALRGEAGRPGSMAAVYSLLSDEAAQRKVRGMVFAPLMKLCSASTPGVIRFPKAAIALTWAALVQAQPQMTKAAITASTAKTQDAAAIDLFNKLCVIAAEGLREEKPEFAVAADCLNRDQPEGTALFASFLDLSSLARSMLNKLPEWIGRMTDERIATARVAYKDAVAMSDDAGPQFFEMIYANLSEPWMILRLLSAVMDHPGEGYVAVSELSRFGVYILDDIDRRLDILAKFDPIGGAKVGADAAEQARIAAIQIGEFESTLEISREGVWGRRLLAQKQKLAQLAESRLAKVEKTIEAALPQHSVRVGRGMRAQPRLTADPDPTAIRKAEGVLAFLENSRAANQAGYGAVRTKVMEAVDARIDHYVEDLLENLRADKVEEPKRIHAFLAVAAGLTEIIRGEKAGHIIRRRAAAA
jgi:hypothetical protein